MPKLRKENKILNKVPDLLKILGLVIVVFIIIFAVKVRQMTYTTEEEDFLFLSEILKEQTQGIDSKVERLKIMTDWLHKNVKHGKYKKGYNGIGVANVIREGMGNCGFQACNIACFAELLGLNKHVIIHNRKDSGAIADHAFAEINIDGKWILFDPDKWLYLKNKNNKLLGVTDVVEDTTSVDKPDAAKWIFHTIVNNGYQTRSSWQKTPMPYGSDGYFNYEKYGMFYIYKKKMSGDIIYMFLISLAIGICGYFLLLFKKSKLIE